MVFLFWFLLVLAGSCLFFLVPALYGRTIYDHYRGVRQVTCPQTHGPALVRFDALHAAVTGVFDREQLRLASCSLWPERMHCDQACIPDAAAFQWPVFREEAPAAQKLPDFARALERKQERQQKDLQYQTGAAQAEAPKPVRAGAKVGRNDPCPCGSGKKYKKCHGANA